MEKGFRPIQEVLMTAEASAATSGKQTLIFHSVIILSARIIILAIA
jgi:hypothetical protein